MIVTKQYLRELIKEELEKAVLEEQEMGKKAAIAGVAMAAAYGLIAAILVGKGLDPIKARRLASKVPEHTAIFVEKELNKESPTREVIDRALEQTYKAADQAIQGAQGALAGVADAQQKATDVKAYTAGPTVKQYKPSSGEEMNKVYSALRKAP